MFDKHIFRAIKFDLVWAYQTKPDNALDKVYANFLRHLLSNGAISGSINPQDLESAVEASGMSQLEDSWDRKKALLLMSCSGSSCLGRFSPEQKRVLRRLLELLKDADSLSESHRKEIEELKDQLN